MHRLRGRTKFSLSCSPVQQQQTRPQTQDSAEDPPLNLLCVGRHLVACCRRLRQHTMDDVGLPQPRPNGITCCAAENQRQRKVWRVLVSGSDASTYLTRVPRQPQSICQRMVADGEHVAGLIFAASAMHHLHNLVLQRRRSGGESHRLREAGEAAGVQAATRLDISSMPRTRGSHIEDWPEPAAAPVPSRQDDMVHKWTCLRQLIHTCDLPRAVQCSVVVL